MKIIFDECSQTRRYGDSEGLCLVQLEEGDNAESIVKEFTKQKEWHEEKYSSPKRLYTYTYKKYKYIDGKCCYVDEVCNGDLILFNTYRAYLD